MKLNIYIRNPEAFLKGDTYNGLDIVSVDDDMVDWIERDENTTFVTEIELDYDFNVEILTAKAVDKLDTQLKETRAKAQVETDQLESRKANLLALPSL